MNANGSFTYYRGVMVYDGSDLAYMLQPEGMVRKIGQSFVYQYNLTDHVGSVRSVLAASGTTLQEVQQTDYYPFGLAWSYDNLQYNKYLFGSKELQDGMLGGKPVELYDFHARFYDPLLGRMTIPDPLAKARPHESLFSYCGNNPISRIDPSGMIWGSARDSAIMVNDAKREIGNLRDDNTSLWDRLIKASDKGDWSQFEKLADRFGSNLSGIIELEQSIREIQEMGNNPDFVFELRDTKGDGPGKVSRELKNGAYNIIIKFNYKI